ncbi:uncharacterized protein B0J16DRAFT_167396 [Fusarium flagelliforme]|uniref:uncharacterized protein n=1 Tax=Fusarium flagelliforme TaxID=2675880 RepID=UPI001E8CF0CF|nr:uncharacterized protein B0J16DRAFT_167396 [Fusarium flagelliforme]KAH7179180.1 hypothetical protein B0J16DRAFT_167396 [Fusarium flagelliforme]
MGFFSNLFTRKSNAKRASVKGQSYNATVASIPPIQGTFPVSGNGPNVLDQLQRAARKRSQAQLSTVSRDDYGHDSIAPPPMVPRFHGQSRPTTAPNQANSTASRPLSLSRSIRSSNSAWSVPEKPSRGRTENPPPVPSIPTHHRRESSIDSFQDKRHSFIDVLDAQGEFSHPNFRSRLSATGAREYDEDVAERNLGDNGLNLNSAATKAYYRLSGSGHLELPTNDREYEEDDDDDYAPYPGVPHGDSGTKRDKRSKSNSSVWRRSYSGPIGNDLLRTSKSHLREKRSESPKASLTSLRAPTLSKADRRRSFNAFASPQEEEEKSRKPRSLSLHPSISSFSYDRPPSPPTLLPPQLSPPSASPPPVQRSRPRTSEGRSRGRSFNHVEIEPVEEDDEDFAPFPTVPSRFRLSEHRSTSYLEPSYGYDHHERHNQRPESYHGGLAMSLNEMPHFSRPTSASSMDKSFNRSRTMTSIRSQRLDDINEHIPVRTSSLFKAQPCVTPSTMSSGFSSNPFPRSVGHHTPSTSIDASLPPSIKLHPEPEPNKAAEEASYYNAGDDEFSADTLVPSRREIERDLGHPFGDGINLDLYLSDASEDSVDSFVAWKEKRRNEEGLLMKDAYGTGAGLPGLFEPVPILKASVEPPSLLEIPVEPVVAKRPKTPKSPKNTRPSTRSSKSTPNRSQQRSRQSRRSTNTPRHTKASNDQDSDSDWEDEIPSAPTAPGFVSLADLGIDIRELGWDQFGLTEADDAKVDMQTAIKLRKAIKAKKQRQKEEEEACAADVEDH